MRRFDSRFGPVTLNKERERHITTFHPDVRPYIKHIESVLKSPEKVRSSRHDKQVLIFYRKIPGRKVYLAVVVKTGVRSFVLIAYLTRSIKQ